MNTGEVKHKQHIAHHLKEFGLDPAWGKVFIDATAKCEKPRRDDTPCFWCDSCYRRWSVERQNGIKHDDAVNKMMVMYEEIGRE